MNIRSNNYKIILIQQNNYHLNSSLPVNLSYSKAIFRYHRGNEFKISWRITSEKRNNNYTKGEIERKSSFLV